MPAPPRDALRRRDPAGVRREFCRLHEDNDGGSIGLQRVRFLTRFLTAKHRSRAGKELNPSVEVRGDGDAAVDDEERDGVGDRGCSPLLHQVLAAIYVPSQKAERGGPLYSFVRK
jgi:hypothetical protein